MKIAIVTAFPRDPGAPQGGVESVSVILTRALAQRADSEIHVVTVDSETSEPGLHSMEGVVIHRLPRGQGHLLPFAIGQGRRMMHDYLYRLRPNVVHAHDTFGIMTWGLDLPRVFTIHGFIHEDTIYGGGLKAKLRSRLWKQAELSGWAEQPHVISISPYVRERLRGIATGVIHDIENPVAQEYFDVIRADDGDSIFSAGSICQRKNTLGLVQAFSKVASHNPTARLRLAGPVAEPAYAEKLTRFIRSADLEERVELLGSISIAAMREELRHASVFALLSFEEGAPMGIAEAMAAGVPVVTSNRCGMPYMVRDGETGFLIEPDDPASVADSLNHLLGDDMLRGQMGESARATALRQFHPDQVSRRTLRVYEMAVASRRKRTNPMVGVPFPDEVAADLLHSGADDRTSPVITG